MVRMSAKSNVKPSTARVVKNAVACGVCRNLSSPTIVAVINPAAPALIVAAKPSIAAGDSPSTDKT